MSAGIRAFWIWAASKNGLAGVEGSLLAFLVLPCGRPPLAIRGGRSGPGRAADTPKRRRFRRRSAQERRMPPEPGKARHGVGLAITAESVRRSLQAQPVKLRDLRWRSCLPAAAWSISKRRRWHPCGTCRRHGANRSTGAPGPNDFSGMSAPCGQPPFSVQRRLFFPVTTVKIPHLR